MRPSLRLSRKIFWQGIISRLYRAGLHLYPEYFRRQFGWEMTTVFETALAEQIQNGWPFAGLFLGREIIETITSALNQHLISKAAWVKTYLDILLAYTTGFTLLGLIDLLNATHFHNEIQGTIVNLLTVMIVGGLGGFTVGIITAPRRKTLFALCGMLALPAPMLFPIRVYHIVVLGVGLTIWKWRTLPRLAGYGALILLVGVFANRLSAALVQSYLYHSPSQLISQTGPGMVLIPFLITGFTLGALLGWIAPERSTIRT